MSNDQADFYADPGNQEPAGPPVRRTRPSLTSHVPVRFRPDIIKLVKRYADQDRKSVSSWIRDIVEQELDRRRVYESQSATRFRTHLELHFEGDNDPHVTRVGALEAV